MPKSKIITINGEDITLRELRVRDIYDLLTMDDGVSMGDRFDDLLRRGTDISREQMLDWTPTDIKELLDAVKEVNSSFLDLAAMVGLDDPAAMMRKQLHEQFAGLSGPDTAPLSGITAGVSS